jgi:hypothetical protein
MSSKSGAERVKEEVGKSDEVKLEPIPFLRELPPGEPFPVDVLGDVLGPAALGIHDKVRAPLGICGQSVLATATLATQAQANVELPTSQSRPLSSYFMSIGVTGERKSAADCEAAWPVRKREAALREKYDYEHSDYTNAHEAWEKAREEAKKKGKGDRAGIKAALDAIGARPDAPLFPLLTCTEPTYEGLIKAYGGGLPSLGIYCDDGGQFIGGHGMKDDAKLRTSTGLSRLWDGQPIDRVRGGDGVTVLPGRRLAMHLMAQPQVAALFLGDPLLAEQGLLSRVLVTAPESTVGARLWREPSEASVAAVKRYGARILQILEMPLPFGAGKRNELSPRTIPLSHSARGMWIGFHDHIEELLGGGAELEPVRGLANKLPEHAARLGAVLALVHDIQAAEVSDVELECGIALAQHYAAEAMRLFGASQVGGPLGEAQQLLEWLHAVWTAPLVSLPDIYQRGPNWIRDVESARRVVSRLEDYGWLIRVEGGCAVEGVLRQDVWRIVKG